MCRGLKKPFLYDLKEGILHNLLEAVIVDHTLDLEIRRNYINIYYRGGNILRVREIKRNTYDLKFDEKYFSNNPHYKGEFKIKDLPSNICRMQENCIKWVDEIYSLKKVMDYWFSKHPKLEREVQQYIARANNYSPISKDTDFYIADIEYANRSLGARFDIIAIQWDSDSSARKLVKKYKPKIHFFELKYGDNAIGGKSGIEKHLKDFNKFSNDLEKINTVKDEMIEVFKQKRELGLIPSLKKNRNQIFEFDNSLNFGLIFANHKPVKTKILSIILKDDCKKWINKLFKVNANISFFYSNFMGYGLYKNCFFNYPNFTSILKKQVEN
ncbi:hypothetical protein JW887_00015 [Candidatus Dojkabacteria bacterium]|nr:hypothetical protein [Candidatus Dojkabacteria bacterium]